jgi:hypothetical protein
VALIATTAPPSRWPQQTQPLGQTEAPPYLLRVAEAFVDAFLSSCVRSGYRAEEAANVHEAGLAMRAMLPEPRSVRPRAGGVE